MGFHRHIQDRRFAWLIAIVFTVFLYPTVLQAAEEQDAILGTWKITATFPAGNVDNALITFSPGGGLVMDSAGRPGGPTEEWTSGHGTWVHRGGNKFEFAFEQFVIRDGEYVHSSRVDETMSITGDTYQGKFEGRRVSPDGEISPVGVTGTTSAVRLKLLE